MSSHSQSCLRGASFRDKAPDNLEKGVHELHRAGDGNFAISWDFHLSHLWSAYTDGCSDGLPFRPHGCEYSEAFTMCDYGVDVSTSISDMS
mmetsp:Transcript_10389/g.21482  ORF Transcript_10389/g.21482 Transcript_10389/m.21482 type:complete len:91 (+) Transcript_10389:1152-1424(+)